MFPMAALQRLLGISPYTVRASDVPRALRRQKTRYGERGRQNGQYTPYCPPGLTFEEETALADVERDQRCIRASAVDLARRRRG